MNTAIYLIRHTAGTLVTIVEIAMFARAILSWFDRTGEGVLTNLFRVITEPVILPIRALCEKMNWFQNIPIDVPFLLTWLVLMVLKTLLEVL